MINKVIIVGSVGQTPEVRHFPDGTAVVNISIATNEKWKDKTTGEQKKSTEWHKIVFTGKLAEIVGQYVKKGRTLYVEGKLKTRKWTDKDGSDKYSTEIQANQMEMVGGKSEDDGGAQEFERPAQKNVAARASPRVEEPDDDDIPFN